MQATLFQAFRFNFGRNSEEYKWSLSLQFTKNNIRFSFFFPFINAQEFLPLYLHTAVSLRSNIHSSLLPSRNLSHIAQKPTGTRTKVCLPSKRHVVFVELVISVHS